MCDLVDKMDSLVMGYLKQEILNANDDDDKNYQYPSELTMVFIQFLGNILFAFDTIHPDFKQYLQDSGKSVKIGRESTGSYISFGCSMGFISGIYTVIIKCMGGGEMNNPIGIISDIEKCKKREWILKYKDLYRYTFYPKNLTASNLAYNYDQKARQYGVSVRFKDNDNVKLIINCNEWKITYFLNEEQIGVPVNIVKNIKYYLVICIQHWNTQYQIISMKHET